MLTKENLKLYEHYFEKEQLFIATVDVQVKFLMMMNLLAS